MERDAELSRPFEALNELKSTFRDVVGIRVKHFADRFPSKVDEYEDLLTGNPIWVGRTKGIAHMTAEDAIALGASGPTLRASGVDIDLRRDAPYSGYEKFQFKVPVSSVGDVYARYICRVQEMRESTGIIQQCLAGVPEGPIKADAPKVVLPDREKMKTQMEALIYHFKIITEGFTVPPGEVYVATESPRGELGFYIVSDGTPKPYRVHVRAEPARRPTAGDRAGTRSASGR